MWITLISLFFKVFFILYTNCFLFIDKTISICYTMAKSERVHWEINKGLMPTSDPSTMLRVKPKKLMWRYLGR